LSSLASTIGSDLSFFLFGNSCICTGRGEVVRPIAPPLPKAALLLLPSVALSTAAVYRRWDELPHASDADVDTLSAQPDWSQWTTLSSATLLSRLANDLEKAAFSLVSRLGELRTELEQRLSRVVRMSGSGSSLFTLYDTLSEAADAAAAIAPAGSARVCGIDLRAVACELCPKIEIDEL
jgi:4-diphosphocytidyl-2-C-methyl-D-erythritol kinase